MRNLTYIIFLISSFLSLESTNPYVENTLPTPVLEGIVVSIKFSFLIHFVISTRQEMFVILFGYFWILI